MEITERVRTRGHWRTTNMTKKITAQMPNWAKNMRILSEIKQKLYNIEEIQETLNEIETFLTK